MPNSEICRGCRLKIILGIKGDSKPTVALCDPISGEPVVVVPELNQLPQDCRIKISSGDYCAALESLNKKSE